MSAALLRVIEEAIAGETEYPINEHIKAQACAVMAAISEAGCVEWGVRVGPMPADPRKSRHSAMNQIRAYGYGTLVSRVTFPWERAE